jgi:signal transduction histidine kinase/CheY-like chemotaxis protein
MTGADSTETRPRATRAVPVTAGASVAALAAFVLLGWIFDVTALVHVSLGLAPMLPATALGLILAGISLTLAGSRWRWAFRPAQALAAMVALIGLQTFAEQLIDIEAPLRGLLPAVPERYGQWRNMTSHAAAVSFLLFGACLLLAGARAPLARRIFTGSATLGLLAALVSSLGYLFGSEAMLGVGRLQTVAMHTAVALMILFAGVLLLRPDIGWLSFVWGNRPAEIVGRSMLAVVVVLPVITAWAAQRGEIAGWYDKEFRVALITLANIVLLSGLVLLYTRRSARLHDAQLRALEALRAIEVRQREEANESNRRKDEFLATLGHELRNPLAPISAASQVLQRHAGDDPLLRKMSGILDRQARHMTRLIDDLLDASRITMGRIELQKKRTLVAAVIESAIETVRPGIEAAGHALTVTLPAGPVEIEVDATRMSQVILNLVQNAVKFTPPGGEIRVSAEANQDIVVILVRDSGIGLDQDATQDIFGMFEQAKHGNERSDGLGIGLALAKALVEQHGGRIGARSEGIGKGSEFRVTLPRPAPWEGGAEHVAAEEAGPGPATGHRPRRVLLVDDNQDAVEALAIYLRLKGHDARTVYDGPAALALAGRFDADVAVLDIGLPGMSGYELARRMRSEWPVKPLTILALTGWSQPEDKRRAQEAGFDYHFSKPIELPALLEVLSRG